MEISAFDFACILYLLFVMFMATFDIAQINNDAEFQRLVVLLSVRRM